MRIHDPFEETLLRRAFIGIASVILVLLLGAVASILSFPESQPALGPVLVLRGLEMVAILGALVWAVLDKRLPPWVPPSTLALNCLLTLAIVAGSGGHRILSMGVFFVEATQFLLVFAFFVRRQWITVLSGGVLLMGGLVLFLILPRATFPQVLTPDALELGFLYLLVFGLSLVIGFVAVNNGVAQRVTARAHETSERLRIAAFQDTATGLPNGLQLEQDMKDWEALSRPHHPRTLTLAGFRLDGLEELNESQGVEVTTQIVTEIVGEYAQELKELAGRHTELVRPEVFRDLYRVESNLFLFALSLPLGVQPTSNGQGALGTVIQRVEARKPFAIRLDYQGGFTSYPDDATTLRQLLRNLLNLLHSRRAEHRGQFVPFNRDHYQEHLRREALRAAMETSLEAGGFRLVFQPKVDVPTGRSSGFEALARWSDGAFGAVSPAEFIPLAEQTGQITALTIQLLDQAFAFLVELREANHPTVSVGVNLSPGVFVPEFLDRILDRLHANGLGPRLDIEITEGVLMRLSGPLHDRFLRLKALGVSFSIDDFGTGYSNLGYLQTLEADVLKIDKRFIDGIPFDEKNAKLVTAIIQMAHSLGMAVVAEGVEYQEQRDFLATARCDQIQGYFYSKPLAASEALDYLKKNGTGL